MFDRIADISASVLNPAGYVADARARFAEIEDVFWKLERRQAFREQDDASYEAFLRGDWEQAVRIEDEARDTVRAYYDKIAKLGFEGRRIRIVESPVSPYLQWEMQALRIRAGAGEHIRVIPADEVRGFEVHRPLPEMVVLGTRILYEILYDEAGSHCGARKIEDREVIDGCRAELGKLWTQGEDLSVYFEREIANLPPPRARSARSAATPQRGSG